MTPLDDSLRETLSRRAASVPPPADPLAGVEARAGRIRRGRLALAASGAALAVAAVAVAVPAVVGGHPGALQPAATPSAAVPSAAPPPFGWAYRGNAVPAATLAADSRAWAARHPGSALKPLFGQVYEPSGEQELVFVASTGAGYRVGVVRTSGTLPEFLYDEGLSSRDAQPFVLPGDETPRLLVVAAPGSGSISATPDAGRTPFTPLTEVAPGVATGPLPRDHPAVTVRVTTAEGSNDDVQAFPEPPANLLRWLQRGDPALSPSVEELGTAFARAMGRAAGTAVDYRPLFTAATPGGVRYTMGQAWFDGGTTAYTVGFATGGVQGPELYAGPATPAQPWGLVLLVTGRPGSSTDLLVVVPRPGTGQLSYAPHRGAPLTAVANGRSDLQGIAFVDRPKGTTDDQLQSLDGDGNPDRPLYRGPVAPLLCGVTGCP